MKYPRNLIIALEAPRIPQDPDSFGTFKNLARQLDPWESVRYPRRMMIGVTVVNAE